MEGRKDGRHDGPLPLARSEGLLAEDVEDETVVYDVDSKLAHCLAPLAAVVFARADGRRSVAELAELASVELAEAVGEDQVRDALVQLQERDLMTLPEGGGMSRRALVRKGALVGAAAMSIPLVTSIVTPAAAQTQSCMVGISCTADSQCPSFSVDMLTCRCDMAMMANVCVFN